MSMQDTFLLDEVRCGFMIPAAIKQAWAAQLEVLKEIDRVCKKHNIQYFADWGTLLGAVRHGGYVPWDDDLDIVMKREDYIKFMTVARFDMEEGFDVQTFRNHEDCWLFMGKVVGRNGFCFEKEHLRRFHNFPYIACVDIFVLDYVYRDPRKEQERRELCLYMLAVADSIVESRMARADIEQRMRMLEERCGYKLCRMEDPVEMRRYLYGEVERLFALVPEDEADKLTQLFPHGLKGERFQFPKEYYAEVTYLPFENTSIPVPIMYDKMLRQRYKEFFRLVKNAGAHDYPFFEGQKKNLQKVLDFELPEFSFDSARLFRSEGDEACKAMSYKAMARECAAELGRMKEELTQVTERIAIEPALSERTLDLLVASQQLAIDLGNMLEQFLGEGCSVMPLLEQYCEAVYRIYERISGEEAIADEVSEDMAVAEEAMASDIQKLDSILDTVIDDINYNVFARKTVIFLPVLAKDWDSLDGLWKQYANDASCDAYVVPLPYYYKDYDGSPKKVCCEATEFPEELSILDYNLLTPEYLEMLHPEVIVIQNPYDSWNPAISVPEMFYSVNIRKYTDELIYVSPFTVEEYSKSNEREYFNMRYYVTMPGVVYADCIMVQSKNLRRMYIERLTGFAGEETRSVWEQRVTVYDGTDAKSEESVFHKDNLCEKSNNLDSKKKMLYGISLGACLEDLEAAQAKIEHNLQIFDECREQVELAIVLFPDSEDSNPVREYIHHMSEKYPDLVAKAGSGSECYVKDYDAYYGDVTPLVMEFRDAGKMVMIQDYGIQSN